jgi:general secretion pathway protein F
MSGYQYLAIDKSGRDCKGTIEADSERQARQLLREQGLILTQLHAFKQPSKTYSRRHYSHHDLCLLTRQLATLLSAGIPLEEALRGVAEQSTKPAVRNLIFSVRSRVVEGFSLAKAMSDASYAFPELYRATVAAGEQTGHLDRVLEKLADYTEYQQQMQQKIQQALIYPLLMIVISTSIIGFLLAFVVPKIIDVFNDSHQALPFMTQILIALSNGLQSYGLYAMFTLVCMAFIFRYYLRQLKIKTRWHRMLLRITGINFLIKATNVARYTHTFFILFTAGVSILETMRVSASLLSNISMQNAFNQATLHVKEGKSICSALRETSYLDPMALHLINSGEKSGQLAAMMERTAVHLDRQVGQIIDTAMTLLEPLIIILMGGVILFIVLATLLPIFSMEQLIT